MSAVITVLCWGLFIVWLGRHEFAIARDRIADWRAQRDNADRLGDCFARLGATERVIQGGRSRGWRQRRQRRSGR